MNHTKQILDLINLSFSQSEYGGKKDYYRLLNEYVQSCDHPTFHDFQSFMTRTHYGYRTDSVFATNLNEWVKWLFERIEFITKE